MVVTCNYRSNEEADVTRYKTLQALHVFFDGVKMTEKCLNFLNLDTKCNCSVTVTVSFSFYIYRNK